MTWRLDVLCTSCVSGGSLGNPIMLHSLQSWPGHTCAASERKEAWKLDSEGRSIAEMAVNLAHHDTSINSTSSIAL